MMLCCETVKSLAKEHGLTQNQLAYRVGVGRGSLSNALSGRRGVGRKTLVGLLRLFPEESVASLTAKRQVKP